MRNNEYEDLMSINHFEPKHKRMNMTSRAAQFSPFAALNGYEDAIIEKNRITYDYLELCEDKLNNINYKLQKLKNKINTKPKIKVLYFMKDVKKDGGKYIEYIGILRVIDSINKFIIFTSGKKIGFDLIYDISDEEFI